MLYHLPALSLHFHTSVLLSDRKHTTLKRSQSQFLLLSLLQPFKFPLLSRHNQRSLEVQKDPDHKNRCRVHFPEVFSSFPYTVNVTAVNALGKASTTISFDESSIGKIDVVSCFVKLCCLLFHSPLFPLYCVASGCKVTSVVLSH